MKHLLVLSLLFASVNAAAQGGFDPRDIELAVEDYSSGRALQLAKAGVFGKEDARDSIRLLNAFKVSMRTYRSGNSYGRVISGWGDDEKLLSKILDSVTTALSDRGYSSQSNVKKLVPGDWKLEKGILFTKHHNSSVIIVARNATVNSKGEMLHNRYLLYLFDYCHECASQL